MGKRRWRWENVKVEFSFLKTTLFGHMLKNKSAHSFVGAWSFLLIHIWFTPSEGLKDFVNWFFKKSVRESWNMKFDHEKRPPSMV